MRKLVLAATLAGIFFCGGLHAQTIVHDPVSFVGIIEQVYNGYERILGMYNQIKTQAEQYKAQVQAMQTFKSRFKDSMSGSLDNLKNAFKDLNSFENLTDIQKVEASRQAIRNLVKTEQAYEQEVWDVTAGSLKRGVYSPSGQKYTVGQIIGIGKDGKFDPRKGVIDVLHDAGEYFEQEEKDLVDAWNGNLTNEERAKLYAEYGASEGAQFYLEMRKEQRQVRAAELSARMDKVALMEEKQRNHMNIKALSEAIDYAEDSQATTEELIAQANVQLYLAELQGENTEAIKEVINVLMDAQQANEDAAVALKKREQEEERQVQQRANDRYNYMYVKGLY